MCLFRLLGRGLKYKVRRATCKGRTFDLEIADTQRKLTIGLMNKEKMSKRSGMLFIFPNEARHKFWMLNMKFAIDILWLDGRKRVVHVARDAKPCGSIFTCKGIEPPHDARYVVELKSGVAREAGISVGDSFKF